MIRRRACLIINSLILTGSLQAAEHFSTERVVTLPGVPWGIAQLSTDTIIYTLRSGKVGLINTQTKQVTPLTGLPEIAAGGQGGLLDVAVPRDYNSGDWIYFTYSQRKRSQDLPVTTLARATLNGKQLLNWTDLLPTVSGTTKPVHFGSRITFDDKQHVYFGVGDRGVRQNAQNNANHAGSILRLTLDGGVPKDNPFVNQAPVLPEIYSFGHRNPQGLHYDHQTQRLWSVEHGPRGGDEINLIQASKNYGWPVISFGKEYWGPMSVGEGTAKAGMEQPVKQYTPSIAPGSLVVYRGDAFPQWQGNLLVSALKLRHINRVELNQKGQAIAETRMLESLKERIRGLLIDDDGLIYFSTDSGKIMRIVPKK